MKKLIALLLALVICAGILTGICFAADKPEECTPGRASVVVTHVGDQTAKYYFDDLTQEVISWACADLAGDTTITVTKDIDLDRSSSTNYFTIPFEKKHWHNSNPDAKHLIFDLGGNTLSCTSNSYLFKMTRYGITVKNGTIEYSGTRSVFGVGNSTEYTATSNASSVYRPVINLENVHIYNIGTGAASHVLLNYIFGTTVNVKDSVLYAAKLSAINMSKTDQSKLNGFTKYEGDATLTVSVENSTVISGQEYPISLSEAVNIYQDTVSVSVKDSTLVSTNGAPYDIGNTDAFTTNGQSVKREADWSLLLKDGTTATGTAYIVGAGAGESKLPFTDVKESEWYYTFVRDLYNAGIISGMTATTFAPNGTLTYGQALKLITLAIGASEQAAVDTHWASGYLNYAMGKGWLNNEVNLDAKITREQFCQIAAAAAGIVEQPAVNPFKDTADGAVLALYNAGIINGMTATTFSPDASLTRAQISKIIHGIISH